jgi:S-adenosylmethionine synthetase
LLDEERDEVVVWMYNRIGKPVGEPMAVVVEVTADTVSIESSVKSIVGEHLNRIDDMYKRLINGTSRLGY